MSRLASAIPGDGPAGNAWRSCVPARCIEPGDTLVSRVDHLSVREFPIVSQKVNGPDMPWEQT
jgi:hypothetical protein